jgi:hypothetical protein
VIIAGYAYVSEAFVVVELVLVLLWFLWRGNDAEPELGELRIRSHIAAKVQKVVEQGAKSLKVGYVQEQSIYTQSGGKNKQDGFMGSPALRVLVHDRYPELQKKFRRGVVGFCLEANQQPSTPDMCSPANNITQRSLASNAACATGTPSEGKQSSCGAGIEALATFFFFLEGGPIFGVFSR